MSQQMYLAKFAYARGHCQPDREPMQNVLISNLYKRRGEIASAFMYILCDFRKTEIYDPFTLLFKNSVEIC